MQGDLSIIFRAIALMYVNSLYHFRLNLHKFSDYAPSSTIMSLLLNYGYSVSVIYKLFLMADNPKSWARDKMVQSERLTFTLKEKLPAMQLGLIPSPEFFLFFKKLPVHTNS